MEENQNKPNLPQDPQAPNITKTRNYQVPLMIFGGVLILGCISYLLLTGKLANKPSTAEVKTSEQTLSTTLAQRPELKDGGYVLSKLKEVYASTQTYAFQGETDFYHLEGLEESSKNNFSGQVVRPDKLTIQNNSQTTIRRKDQADEVYSSGNEIILLGDKVIERSSNGRDRGTWGVQPITNPFLKNDINYLALTQTYSKPTWLLVPFAKNLVFIGQESGLLHYNVTPQDMSSGEISGWVDTANHIQGGSPTSLNKLVQGEIWVDSSLRLVKEKYFIGPSKEDRLTYHMQGQEGFGVTITYSRYNEPVKIEAPKEVQAQVKYYDDLAAGKDPEQVEKEYQNQLLKDNPNLPATQRDEKRLSDMRELSSKLYLYSISNPYPKSLNDLRSFESLFEVPVAPTPVDGNCTSEQNQYNYSKISDSSYRVSFCLGAKLEDFTAGVHYLTQDGIK